MKEIKKKETNDILKELNKYKRGIREYIFKIFKRSLDVNSDLEYLFKYFNFDTIDQDDLNEVNLIKAKEWIINGLIGNDRGWINNVMDKDKADYFWRMIYNLFDNSSLIFSNQIDSGGWNPFYNSDKFIFSNGIIIFDDNQFGFFCIQESD